jgi:predicted PurR-regulated permease PerM
VAGRSQEQLHIIVPRWAQFLLIPLVVIVVLFLIPRISHAVFVFVMAMLLALLLNPIVESLRRVFLPRIVAVPLVYLTFAALVVVLALLGVPPVIDQARRLLELTPQWLAELDDWLADLQEQLAGVGMNVDLQSSLDRATGWLESQSLSSAGTLFTYTIDVVASIATFVLVIIISFYMLMDGRRIHRYLRRVAPGDEATAGAYLKGMQASFTRYIKGQLLLGTSVGLAAGLGIWALGWDAIGIWPEGSQYALLFGVWAGVTEVIPYIGPWLGAAPPVFLALFHSPAAALWVAGVYFAVQQLENHILVPNIMGSSVGVHPLVVIFSLLAGAQVAGVIGMLAVLPLLAMLRHTLDFYDLRLSRAAWIADDGIALPAPPGAETAGSSRARPAPAPPEAQPLMQPGTPTGSAEDDAASDRPDLTDRRRSEPATEAPPGRRAG